MEKKGNSRNVEFVVAIVIADDITYVTDTNVFRQFTCFPIGNGRSRIPRTQT